MFRVRSIEKEEWNFSLTFTRQKTFYRKEKEHRFKRKYNSSISYQMEKTKLTNNRVNNWKSVQSNWNIKGFYLQKKKKTRNAVNDLVEKFVNCFITILNQLSQPIRYDTDRLTKAIKRKHIVRQNIIFFSFKLNKNINK